MNNLNTRIYRLYDYLKEHCVGKDNITTYNDIANGFCNKYLDDNEELATVYINSHSVFKKDIQKIREHFDRKICSTCQGYYLPTSSEENSKYMTASALRLIKTCLAQGVGKNIFYDALNDASVNLVADNQEKLNLGKSEKEITKRYSNDLVK